jgi:hypothetical protein
MWAILMAEMKYQRRAFLILSLVAVLALAIMVTSGVFEQDIRQGRNLGFLFLFALFAAYMIVLPMDPSAKEKRPRFLVVLPISLWHMALANWLVLLMRWLISCLLFGLACLIIPDAFRWNREAALALAAQTGMVFIILSAGQLHFEYAWPAFRRRVGQDLYKVLIALLMILLWCQIYLFSIIQIMGLVNSFKQNKGTLFYSLYQTPSGSAILLLIGLVLHFLLMARFTRQRSFVQG